MSDFPQRLSEKLKTIREHSKLSPDEFAPHVQAKDGAEIISYEKQHWRAACLNLDPVRASR